MSRLFVGASLSERPSFLHLLRGLLFGQNSKRGGHGAPPLQFVLLALLFSTSVIAQTDGSHASRPAGALTPEALELVERAISIVCSERERDPLGSSPIDDMQGRPSLPLHTPEAIAGARRAQRLLPAAKTLTIKALRELSSEYNFHRIPGYDRKLRGAIARLQSVRWVKPDMESRDNASVFLRRPHTITFGTIFLAGLPSDEGMISVLSHELMHIADGGGDSLKGLFDAIGTRASRLTGLEIKDQKAEELTCDLVGLMAARFFVSATPDYQPLTRRVARSVAHNCVTEDEGDDDHLSPRTTVRALFALRPVIVRELVYGEVEIRRRLSR